MTYKLIQECGLKTYQASVDVGSGQGFCDTMIRARDLEAFLSKGVRVYNDGERTDEYWNNAKYHKNTHTALVIDYKPIPKLEPVSKEELRSFIENAANTFRASEYVDFLKRIEKAGLR